MLNFVFCIFFVSMLMNMRSVFQNKITALERKLNYTAEGVAFHLFSFSHCVLISVGLFHKCKSSSDLRQYVQSILVTWLSTQIVLCLQLALLPILVGLRKEEFSSLIHSVLN